MTGPIDWNALYGVGSPQFNSELQFFNATRDSFLQQMLGTMAARRGLPASGFQGNTQPMGMQQGIGQGPAQQQVGAPAQVSHNWTDEDLVGAAQYWGVPEDAARSMPRDQLIGIVDQMRHNSRPTEDTFMQRLGATPAMLGALPAMFTIGAGEAITGGLQRLPVIGEALSRISLLHDADQKLRMMEEGVRASTPESFQWVNSGANIAGNLTSMFYPATSAWAVAGKIGTASTWAGILGETAGPIARLATQGAGAAILLAGRGVPEAYMRVMSGQRPTDTDQEALQVLATVGGGAALPVAWSAVAPVAGKLATRVGNAFGIGDVMQPARYLESPMARTMSRGVGHIESVVGSDSPDYILQLRGMAEAGNTQAQAMLDYMGPRAQFANTPEDAQRFFSGANFSTSMEIPANVNQSQSFAPPAFSGGDVPRGPDGGYANAIQQQPDYSPQVGNRPERFNLSAPQQAAPNYGTFQPDYTPQQGFGPERGNWNVPSAGLNRGPTNTPLIGLNTEEAQNAAAQANKAATIIQSPAFPSIAGQASLDEVSVARAAVANNPGGSSIVQGVSDPANFIRGSIDQLGQNIRFAQRGTRLDAMISDQPITDVMVNQYERHGVYTGQRVLTPEGIGATVRAVENSRAWIDPLYSGAPRSVSVLDLHPWMTSPGVADSPPLWDAFSRYADQRVASTATAMGGAITPEQLISVRQENLMQYMQDFMDDAGIMQPGDRARVRSYFNLRYVDSLKDLAPAEIAAQQSATGHYGAVAAANPLTEVGTLDQMAATKGFTVIPVHEGKWIVSEVGNSPSPVKVTFESAEAAQKWISGVNKELPDITPASDTPIELVAQHPQEPTQALNANKSTPSQAVSSVAELADESDGGSNVPPAQVAAARGNFGRLKNLWTDGFLRWRPARRFFSQIDQALVEGGLPSGIAADYDKISNSITMHHNEMHPYMDELTDIFKGVKTEPLVTGRWTRIYEMEPGQARVDAAVKAGINPNSFTQYEGLMQKLFPETGLDEIRRIPQYISHIAQRQSDPELMGRAFEDFQLGPTTQPFYEYARTGNLNMREMDPRVLGESYIRSVFWQKNMAEPFNAVVSKWKGMAADPTLAPAANVMENWLRIIRYGYHADDDFALDVMHGAMRAALGPEITRQHARELFNFGLNTTHAGLLGFRLNVMARDIQQFWLAVPRAGGDLLNVMRRYATSAADRETIWNDALNAGAIALQSPRMAAPGTFAGEMERVGVAQSGDASMALATMQDPRARAAARIVGAVRDIMPGALKDSRDTMLHPMYMYGKQSELMRALVYTAGKEKAESALASFRAAGPAGDFEKLLGDSGARTFDPSWQRQFQNIVASGDDVGAASFLGRQLADATQFKYGITESPWVAKSLTGRVAMQMGNYAMQYFQYLRESLTNGTVSDKTKFLATVGTVTAGIEAASRATGWNFRMMNPFFGLGFAGGPWLGVATNIAQGANAIMGEVQGYDASQTKLNAMNNALGQGAGFLNPLGGVFQNVRAVADAQQSPYPAAALTRSTLTGQIDNGPDVERYLQSGADAMLQRMMQPAQTPVSTTRPTAPFVPQRQPVYPLEMTTSRNSYPGVTDPSQVYQHNGHPTYDTRNAIDGHVPSHNLNMAGQVLQQGETWEQAEQRVVGAQYSSKPPVVNDVRALDADTYNRVQSLMEAAKQAGLRIEVGETARSQERQNYLFAQGRSAQFPGKPVTWTLTSDHGQGNAVDFTINGDSSGRDPGYQWLQQNAGRFGLVTMGSMDPFHVAATDSSRAAVPWSTQQRGGTGTPDGGGGGFF